MALNAIFQAGKGGGRFRRGYLVVVSDVLSLRIIWQRLIVHYGRIVLDIHGIKPNLLKIGMLALESKIA